MKNIFMILSLILTLSFTIGCNDGIESKKTDSEKVTDNKDISALDNHQNEENFLYTDVENGFTLELPSWWEGQYNVKNEIWIDAVSKSINFNYNNKDFPGNIFAIIIQDEIIKEEDFEDPFLTYITEYNGKTFAYLSAMEPNEDLLKEENEEYLNIITKMVEEVPQIIETFDIKK